jgi:hypothetical protein
MCGKYVAISCATGAFVTRMAGKSGMIVWPQRRRHRRIRIQHSLTARAVIYIMNSIYAEQIGIRLPYRLGNADLGTIREGQRKQGVG